MSNITDDNVINVVVYSKFSQASTKLIGMIDKNPPLKQNTHLLCIDNEEVRKRVVKSQKLNIKHVPCIMRLHESNGYVESFEGEKAFSLVNTYYIEYLERQQAQPPQPPPQQLQSYQQSQQPQQSYQQQEPPRGNSSTTPLGNLMELTDDEMPTQNSNTLNTYLHIPSQLDGQNTNMPTVDRAVKKESGSANIVSRAMQMQKERDNETSSNGPKMALN
jgi:hypothetical protein